MIWIVVGTLALCLLLELAQISLMQSWVTRTVWGLFFFACGYWLKEYEQKWWLVIIAIIVFVISMISPIHNVYGVGTPLWCRLVWCPSCALACVFFNNICLWLSNMTKMLGSWQFPVLRYIGRNAMNFYVPHYIIFAMVYNVIGTYYEAWYSGLQGLVIVTIAYAFLLPAINCLDRYIKCAKKCK